MYGTIIVPLDGSAFAEHALPVALEIARRSGAALRLVRVHEPVPAFALPSGYLPPPDGSDDAAAARERDYLEALARGFRGDPGPEVAVELLDGPVVDALRNYARDRAASLIVMTTHGRGPLTRVWLGSVADGLVRHAAVPVLFIRPRAGEPGPDPGRLFRQVLIPLDGSSAAEAAVPHAVALGRLADARYTLLHVLPPATLIGPALPEDAAGLNWSELEEHAAEASLEREAARMRLQSLQVKKRVVRHGHTAQAILDFACEDGADLIALATHGRPLSRLVLGNVADKVIRGSTAPVLICRPPEG